MIKWFAIVGLFFDIIGSILLIISLMVSKKRAIELGVSRLSGTTEENRRLPKVKDIIKQRNFAIAGGLFLIVGFVLQIIAQLQK